MARGEFVLSLLLALQFLGVFGGEMAIRERVEGFQLGLLFLPGALSGGRIADLLRDGLSLRIDGLVKSIEELLIVVPFAPGQAILRCMGEACCVFVTILLQHIELVFCVAFVGDQSGERLGGIVRAGLHQFEDDLKRKWFGHAVTTDLERMEIGKGDILVPFSIRP